MDKNKISLVTMFFDIGRGDWSKQNGIADFANRDNDKYFAYFAHLAKLKNDMVVFTTPNFNERIRQLREDRPTTIINIDLESKFGDYIRKIEDIQNSENFVKHIPESLRQNPEYRSPKYVLINNLKTYFVKQAIEQGLPQQEQVAWVDFGYCRDANTLAGINEWQYNFDKNYMHFFTIKPKKKFGIIPNPKFPTTMESTKQAMYHNRVFIIGSIFVGTKSKWSEFYTKLTNIQLDLLDEGIIDDDQGVYLMYNTLHGNDINLHYLADGLFSKPNWFGLFQQFHV